MKIFVLCDEAGDIQSVAIPSEHLAAGLHLEVEGGGTARIFDVDERTISADALLGRTGADAQRQVHEHIRKLLRTAKTAN